MEKLSPTWLTDRLIDFEYKKYILLAYLKNVKSKFDDGMLYPQMADLVAHYRNIIEFKENKDILYDSFPKEISKMDLAKLKVTYQHIIQDEEIMRELGDIINYALPRMETTLEEGKELYDWIEDNLSFSPVGVVPVRDSEGYFFLNYSNNHDLMVYRYNVTLFETSESKYRGIKTTFIKREYRSLIRTVEQIKVELIKHFKDLPNPATFLITSELELPLNETLLPVSKRLLMQKVGAGK